MGSERVSLQTLSLPTLTLILSFSTIVAIRVHALLIRLLRVLAFAAQWGNTVQSGSAPIHDNLYLLHDVGITKEDKGIFYEKEAGKEWDHSKW